MHVAGPRQRFEDNLVKTEDFHLVIAGVIEIHAHRERVVCKGDTANKRGQNY